MSWPAGERIAGIDIPLPPGETVRWQGAPDWRSLARNAFHVRKIAAYFGLLLLWRGVLSAGTPAPVQVFLAGAVPLTILAGLAMATSVGLAWLTSRATWYAVTDRRVVMRIGLVINSVVNIPFRQVESADVKRHGDGTGDLALRLGGSDRIAYFHLWPHARGWRVSRPEPAFRSVSDPDRAATALRDAIAFLGDPIASGGPAHSEPAPRGNSAVRDLVQTT